MKKWMAMFLAVLILTSTIGVYADFSDVPRDAIYAEALNRLAGLGIMGGNEDGSFRPEEEVTREQFAKMIVIAAGLEETAISLMGSTTFPDVDPAGWSCGYINAAVNGGLLPGMTDGSFHPYESINFAQACTIMVRALGYTDQDVPGLWPKNFLEKAKSLGLTKDIHLSAENGLTRWAAALMLDRLLVTNIKKSAPTAADVTYADSVGLFTECIVLGNARTDDRLTERQVLTNKGIYYLPDGAVLELGRRYEFKLNGDTVEKYYEKFARIMNLSILSAVDAQIRYRMDGAYGSMVLPDKTTYYYQGTQQTYDNLKTILQAYSSVILAYNADRTGYAYGVILDPVYSKPEVAANFDPSTGKLGSLDLGGNLSIVRNTIDASATPPINNIGEAIDLSKIKSNDVVYRVSDVWGLSQYILVISNKVEGSITGILPNKMTPKTIQINDVNYDLDKSMDISKLNNTPGSFKLEDSVTCLLGHDGKVVDVVNSAGNSAYNYAFVLNGASTTSKDSKDFNATTYTVKLLFTDGTTDTFKIDSAPYTYKGKLVKYTKVDAQTVTLEKVDYINPIEYIEQPSETSSTGTAQVPSYRQYVVNKIDGMINNYYIAENIKIFNLMDDYVDKDTDVSLVDWNRLPNGKIPDGKVLYMTSAGPFNDITVLLVEDIFNEKSKMAVVTSAATSSGGNSSFGLLSGTESSSLSKPVAAEVGSVVRLALSHGSVSSAAVMSPRVTASVIQNVDLKRIMIDNSVYRFNNKIRIYFKGIDGTVAAKGISDIAVNKTYTKVCLYMDDSGKVEAVVIFE